jgi:ribosome biogenesis protein BMS1
LKYEFCYAVIFGNYIANNTGVTFLKNLTEDGKAFRVGGTGVVIGFSKDYEIKKKLKLIGEPDKVFKKTAIIKNMFNSQMEVQKFIGAKIKTVSGIRG